MKIHILSDLHMEIFPYHIQILDADIIILAGDIAEGLDGLQWAASILDKTDAHILYVAGNHEFYHLDIIETRTSMRQFCSQYNRLHYLENDELIINDVRFLGATLWTDYNQIKPEERRTVLRLSELSLTDFRLINRKNMRLTIKDIIHDHQTSAEFLNNKLDDHFSGKTVVISHHAPHYQSIAPKYQQSLLDAYFASQLDHLLDRSELWIHGHTHVCNDYHVGKTRVISNPRGRPLSETTSENKRFNPTLLMTV